MRRTRRNAGFFVSLLINLLLNFEGIIPAVILYVLHRCLGLSVWWSAAALALWILGILFWMLFLRWAGKCSNIKDPPKENKNPYSAGRKP